MSINIPVFQRLESLTAQFGNQIKKARMRRRISLSEIRRKIGISKSTLQSIENGALSVSLGKYMQILSILELENDILYVAKDDDISEDEIDTADTKTADTKTADTKTADTKTADTKTADTKTADTKTADTKTTDTKTTDTNKKIKVKVFNSEIPKSTPDNPFPDIFFLPIGILEFWREGNCEMLSFQYEKKWLEFKGCYPIIPNLPLRVEAYTNSASHVDFSIFLEHEEYTWFKCLMEKKEEVLSKNNNRQKKKNNIIDYINNIYKNFASGKLVLEGESICCPSGKSTLEGIASNVKEILEDNLDCTNLSIKINNLIENLGGLGGACPKVAYEDEKGAWVAKFSKCTQGIDLKRRKEVYNLASTFSLNVPETKLITRNNKAYAIVSKRFDRESNDKISFATAKSLLGNRYENKINSKNIYLKLAEFICEYGDPLDLEELWKRMVLSICIGNRDDNLYNHGFLRREGKWRLSPLFGVKFFIDCISSKEDGMKLSIGAKKNTLNLNLAIKLAKYFGLSTLVAKMHIKKLTDIILKEKRLLLSVEAMGIKKITAIKEYADKIPAKGNPNRGDDGRYKKKD